MPANHQSLQSIKTFEDLASYLESALDWPLAELGFEDATFEYSAAEVGLKPDESAKVRLIRQLRPLQAGQPWGIFFVEFESKKFPVTVLRRILGHLVVKKRASANKADAPVWHAEDLLFVSAFGEEGTDQREIAFAHFHQAPGDLPTLRVLGWDGADTELHVRDVDSKLRASLRWPDTNESQADWRKRWATPFRHRIGHVIRTADALAEAMAELARGIRDRALKMISRESDKGPLRQLHAALRKALIHDLSEADFADTYAQTITYGLLTAAVSRTDGSGGKHGTYFLADNVPDMVPVTNPFLKELLQTFLKAGGRKGGIDFDELGIQDVVELLRGEETDLPAVLRDFGNKTRGEDPVIHFYEHFLEAYDKTLKVKRGVFYTPQPVVSYIVRSVHELLQMEFGIENGLASTITWGEMAKKHPGLRIPKGYLKESPFVIILDPACGTGTFIVEVIDLIHKTMLAKWRQEQVSEEAQRAAWNQYVPESLLPRIYGYELMMAPYAIAHMRIGLKLGETGYRFQSQARARVYLTNALEPSIGNESAQLGMFAEPFIATEAAIVSIKKKTTRFAVVIGNPPYSGVSSNNSDHARRLVDGYKFMDGKRLDEKKLWLQDDYVKFLRTGQMAIECSGCGLLGMITNHGYLDNPTFRGMRQSLLGTFHWGLVTDLHGNSKKKEVAPDGSPDVNVFDIQQGVAIGLFVRRPGSASEGASFNRADLFGSREEKCRALATSSARSLPISQLRPSTPFYLFAQQDQANRAEFEGMTLLSEVTKLHSVGIVTARDQLTIAFTEEEMWQRVQQFAGLGEEEARDVFGLRQDVRDWKVSLAQSDLRAAPLSRNRIRPILYRPFDTRFTYYTGKGKGFIGQPATAIMSHMLNVKNVGLITTRKVEVGTFEHAMCSTLLAESHSVSLKEVNYLFPLWLQEEATGLAHSRDKHPNLRPEFLRALAVSLGLHQSTPECVPSGLTPEDIFEYIYAILYSPKYRNRYHDFLRTDFPRLPLPGTLALFLELNGLGEELVALHLLQSPALDSFITAYNGPNNPKIERVGWSNDAVWLDAPVTKKGQPAKPGTIGFQGVPEAVWNFRIGGYQVCEKWLKDRKGRTLTDDDLSHYQKIVVALSETIRLMGEIDEAIESHGGWPGAFAAPKVNPIP